MKILRILGLSLVSAIASLVFIYFGAQFIGLYILWILAIMPLLIFFSWNHIPFLRQDYSFLRFLIFLGIYTLLEFLTIHTLTTNF